MKQVFVALLILIILSSSCSSRSEKKQIEPATKTKAAADSIASLQPASLAEMLAKKEVPVLCYHHIRNFSASQSESMKSYSVTPANFAAQIKALYDSGYQTILPAQLYDHLVYGAALPPKPVMLTFDDTPESQYSIGAAEMNK